jgi:hypothetical protein
MRKNPERHRIDAMIVQKNKERGNDKKREESEDKQMTTIENFMLTVVLT